MVYDSEGGTQQEEEVGEKEEEKTKKEIVEKIYVVSDKCIESVVKVRERERKTIFSNDRVFCFGIFIILFLASWSFAFYVLSEEYLEIERYRVYVSAFSYSGGEEVPNPPGTPGQTVPVPPFGGPRYRRNPPSPLLSLRQ